MFCFSLLLVSVLALTVHSFPLNCAKSATSYPKYSLVYVLSPDGTKIDNNANNSCLAGIISSCSNNQVNTWMPNNYDTNDFNTCNDISEAYSHCRSLAQGFQNGLAYNLLSKSWYNAYTDTIEDYT